jgi:hypothetical protein
MNDVTKSSVTVKLEKIVEIQWMKTTNIAVSSTQRMVRINRVCTSLIGVITHASAETIHQDAEEKSLLMVRYIHYGFKNALSVVYHGMVVELDIGALIFINHHKTT